MDTKDYISINKACWNNRVATHLKSDFYQQAAFLAGATSLNSIELDLLGDLTGKRVLHLQCHFGQDSISLARMGAQVTGVDLSDKAIDTARQLAKEIGVDAQFICTDLYELPKHLHEQYDIVFTSYGVLGWLPDMDRWAALVAQFVRPGGQLILVEFHPVVWMFDDDFKALGFSYFNTGALLEEWSGSYADRQAPIEDHCVSWNHSLGSVVTAVVTQGLRIKSLQEFNYSPYNCFDYTIEIAPKKFQIEHCGDKLPMVYALVAEK